MLSAEEIENWNAGVPVPAPAAKAGPLAKAEPTQHVAEPAPLPAAAPGPALLEVQGLVKHFTVRGGLFGRIRNVVRAVDGVDIRVHAGETLGIVGETGCGKSTTARLIMQLIQQDAGRIDFAGKTVGGPDLPLKSFRSHVQMVFQDSDASLDPRMAIEDSIALGPTAYGVDRGSAIARAHRLLDRVGLLPALFARRYPHELSSDQRQRVNIARALALEPQLLILDEAVSALDKSVEARTLDLLCDLKKEMGLTYVFFSHDLHAARTMSSRVVAMHRGRIAEQELT